MSLTYKGTLIVVKVSFSVPLDIAGLKTIVRGALYDTVPLGWNTTSCFTFPALQFGTTFNNHCKIKIYGLHNSEDFHCRTVNDETYLD